MNNYLLKLFVIIVIIIFISSFSASYNSLNIDNLAFVVAMGIDTSETKKIKVTFEFVNPPSSTEGSTQDAKIVIDTVETSSINNAINLMNAYLARKLDLSHCKMIVFSEEIAKNGITDYIYTLVNDMQIRPTANIVISKCTSDYYIENSKPSLETLVTKYYDIFPNSSKYTGYVTNATVGNFFSQLACTTCEPYAILGGIASSDGDSSENNIDDDKVKSGTSIISGTRNSENIGTAVFKNDKLAGELNAIETVFLGLMHNSVNSFLVSVPNPDMSDDYIDLYLTPTANTKIDTEIVNGSPFIKVDLKFSAKISSLSKNSSYLDPTKLSTIARSCDNYLNKTLTEFLYKTSTIFKSDIVGFGKYSLIDFATSTDFSNYNWLDNYMNSTFEVNIETNVDSGFLLTQT